MAGGKPAKQTRHFENAAGKDFHCSSCGSQVPLPNASLNSVGHPLVTAVLTMGWIKSLRRRPEDATQSVECFHTKPWGQSPALCQLGMVTFSFNPSTCMVDVERQEVQGHPQLHNESEASLGYMTPISNKQTYKITRTKCTQEEGVVLWEGEKIGEARPSRK